MIETETGNPDTVRVLSLEFSRIIKREYGEALTTLQLIEVLGALALTSGAYLAPLGNVGRRQFITTVTQHQKKAKQDGTFVPVTDLPVHLP